MTLAERFRAHADLYDYRVEVIEHIEALGRARDAGDLGELRTTGERQFDTADVIARCRERAAVLRLAAEAFA